MHEAHLQESLSEADFISTLFTQLDEQGVRYVVLHSWDSLPTSIDSDLDIGVHPRDRAKLARVVAELRAAGYRVVQELNYFVNANYLVFCWSEDALPHFAALDVIFEHRRGGLAVPSGAAMVVDRRREKNFWVPDPAVEFGYLLSKKAWKRSVPAEQAKRLQQLAATLGTARAEEVARQLFNPRLARQVVAAVEAGTIGELMPRLGGQTWRTSFRRNPLRALLYIAGEGWRRLKRWGRPTGLFVVFLGPDGAGKSTVLAQVKQVVAKSFRRELLFHWRPCVLTRGQPQVGPVNPRQHPPRSALKSVAYLLVHFTDYWLGYILRIRPMLARSTFVLFDRYFYDIPIDPLRFRYGGPMWIPRALNRMVPKPDMVIVLDAPEHALLERKQELELQELGRQRTRYLGIQKEQSNTTVISTTEGVDAAVRDVCSSIVTFLAQRLNAHA
jgi:thymidylate kinase